MNLSQLLVIERSQHKKINREIYTCVSILLFAGDCYQAGQACYGIQLYSRYHIYIIVHTCTCGHTYIHVSCMSVHVAWIPVQQTPTCSTVRKTKTATRTGHTVQYCNTCTTAGFSVNPANMKN